MDNAFETIISIATMIVCIAIVAVLVSKNSGTASVITAAGNAFASILQKTVSI